MRFRLFIFIIPAVFISGCESKEYGPDPYVSMMDNYMSKLSQWDYSSGEMPEAPKEPTYLFCPERGAGRDSYGSSRGTGLVYGPTRCREINEQRKAAYTAAVKKYESIVSETGAEQGK